MEINPSAEWSLCLTPQMIMDTLSSRIAIKDRDFVYRMANSAFCTMLGKHKKDIIGKSDFEIFSENGAEDFREEDKTVLTNGTVYSIEFAYPNIAGVEYWFRKEKYPVLDKKGGICGILVSFENITKYKEYERSNYQFKSIVDSASDTIITTTLDGTISSWNKGAEELFDYSAKEMIGRSASILEHPGQQSVMQLCLKKIRHGEKIGAFETTRVRKNGEEVRVSITMSPVRDRKDNIEGAAIIARTKSMS